MFRQFFIRDRMVMTGLVVLGLVTVAAGFLSGRSTFQYALYSDARLASSNWVSQAEQQLFHSPMAGNGQIEGRRYKVVAPDLLSRQRARALQHPDARIADSDHEGSGIFASFDRLLADWIQGLTGLLDSDNHVSKIADFALLDPSGRLILRDSGFSTNMLAQILTAPAFRAEFHKALGMYSSREIEEFAFPGRKPSEFARLVLVPVIEGERIARVYMLAIDQSSAAAMSKAALVAASVMTSLLIVLGYSIPAAIAFRRIRDRWRAEDQIRFLALHDPLTGLVNRVQFDNSLVRGVARAKRKDALMAVMCLDLDRFKEVNDSLGHQTGDALLREAANRLRVCVRDSDVVARLGGDEFAILAEDLATPHDVAPVARRICEAMARPFEINGHTVSVSASLGITMAPTEGVNSDVLMNNADLALYRAKNDGRNTYRFFEPDMDKAIQARRRMSNDLRRALSNGELTIHYQPQFDLRTGQLTGYEALARWPHPEEGLVPPDEFIPVAEEMGIIGALGEWVLRTACRYAANWPDDLTLSVNVSPVQFGAQDIVATVRRALKDSGFPPERLLLEVTENVLLRNSAETVDALKRLNDLGVSLALDDFGTGYSSLSYLTKFPVKKIKIDRSFVDKISSEENMNAIIGTIVGLGKTLNVTITAEGVETISQAEFLRELGCSEVQGFLFGRPRPDIAARQEDPLADTPQPVPVAPAPVGDPGSEHVPDTVAATELTRRAS